MIKKMADFKLLLIIICIIVITAGCRYSEKAKNLFAGPKKDQKVFQHKTHVGDRGMDCEVCHADYTTSASAGMPTGEVCSTCHDPEDEDTKKLLGNLIKKDGTFVITKRIKFADVIYDHKKHVVDYSVACNVCHLDIEKSKVINAKQIPSMETCLTCHSKDSGNCLKCHKVIASLDFKPESHKEGWLKFHGRVKDPSYNFKDNKCTICHAENVCINCHKEQKPQNHTGFWRQKGHAKFVDIERENCATCHTTSYCVRCHGETRPLTHKGSWGTGQQVHCVNCHLPLSLEDRCLVCHTSAPAHNATPKPSVPLHTAGMNCRQCHGAGVRLPHINTEDDCNICHR